MPHLHSSRPERPASATTVPSQSYRHQHRPARQQLREALPHLTRHLGPRRQRQHLRCDRERRHRDRPARDAGQSRPARPKRYHAGRDLDSNRVRAARRPVRRGFIVAVAQLGPANALFRADELHRQSGRVRRLIPLAQRSGYASCPAEQHRGLVYPPGLWVSACHGPCGCGAGGAMDRAKSDIGGSRGWLASRWKSDLVLRPM